mmetsp:Transcript_53932/g.89840  ORF Transcript_53932/g.89840 Transcript_53932/m.89840 type:complete len:224 (-) Transcript_53932:283-954(-)
MKRGTPILAPIGNCAQSWPDHRLVRQQTVTKRTLELPLLTEWNVPNATHQVTSSKSMAGASPWRRFARLWPRLPLSDTKAERTLGTKCSHHYTPNHHISLWEVIAKTQQYSHSGGSGFWLSQCIMHDWRQSSQMSIRQNKLVTQYCETKLSSALARSHSFLSWVFLSSWPQPHHVHGNRRISDAGRFPKLKYLSEDCPAQLMPSHGETGQAPAVCWAIQHLRD